MFNSEIMKVFSLKLDNLRCDGAGMALVAAQDYESAEREYIENGDCGDDVATGVVVFTKDSRDPIPGLEYSGGMKVLCDCFCFNQDI